MAAVEPQDEAAGLLARLDGVGRGGDLLAGEQRRSAVGVLCGVGSCGSGGGGEPWGPVAPGLGGRSDLCGCEFRPHVQLPPVRPPVGNPCSPEAYAHTAPPTWAAQR